MTTSTPCDAKNAVTPLCPFAGEATTSVKTTPSSYVYSLKYSAWPKCSATIPVYGSYVIAMRIVIPPGC